MFGWSTLCEQEDAGNAGDDILSHYDCKDGPSKVTTWCDDSIQNYGHGDIRKGVCHDTEGICNEFESNS